MRILTITLFLMALPALAQTPDTTDAHRYLPLAVGNVWEYERWEDVCEPEPPFCEPEPNGFFRRLVRGDTTLSGTAYWIIRESYFTVAGAPSGTREYLVRYDSSEARAYEHRLDGEFWNDWPEGLYCPLDIPFEGGDKCEDVGYAESYEETVLGESVHVKRFVTLVGSYRFVADLGLVSTSLGDFVTSGYDLTFARIDEVEYGTEQFPVSTEGAPESAAVALSVYPNPSHAAATVRFTLDRAQRVKLAVYDVLGRRVLSEDLGAQPVGETSHRIDLATLPAGVYVVRLDGGIGTRATARIIRH